MNPVVGLRLTQVKLQRMHRLQRIGLLIDQNKQQIVFTAVQHPFGSAAYTALTWLTCTRQLVRIPFCVGTLKRWEQLLKLFQREAGRWVRLSKGGGPGDDITTR